MRIGLEGEERGRGGEEGWGGEGDGARVSHQPKQSSAVSVVAGGCVACVLSRKTATVTSVMV